MKKLLYMFVFMVAGSVFGQDFSSSINTYLNSNQSELSLQSQDIEDIVIDKHSYSKTMDVENVYVVQQYQGIEIFNSVSSFAIKNGQVKNASLSFSKDVSQKVNTTTPAISAATAIGNAALELGINSPTNLELLETVSVNSFIYSNGSISLENIPVKLVFQKMEDGSLQLAWDLSIYVLDASHYYSVRVDAVTGSVINLGDWVVSCSFGGHKNNSDLSDTENSVLFSKEDATMASLTDDAQYKAIKLPSQSPDESEFSLIVNPSAQGVGSPYGWHDTDGVAGPEHTITRGNNVWAQEDENGNNGTGFSPEGGAELIFDFDFDFTQDPSQSLDASITNLFYLNNMLHDIFYEYGFDEASGNFQQNNYGNGGNGNDFVYADAQDGSGTNNANFATPGDGGKPRMQMFLWDGAVTSGPLLTINDGPLAGDYEGVPAAFGGEIVDLTEDLVLVEDDPSGTSDTNDACDPITNGGDLSGKIAVIRRGECEFGFKALAAENEGAVAVIMVNNVEGEAITMAPGAVGDQVTIPLFMVSDTDGEAIIAELLSETVNATINGVTVGPMIDASLDNEIIAHEYGHGISNRLTGGGNNTGCLNNAEQMGEGWSDYLGLIITMKVGDQADDGRGIATYSAGQGANGAGIRQFKYSRDMTENPLTYSDLPATGGQVHAVGTIWATMLWDLTWDLIDVYGFDEDMFNGTGGNNIAMQLVLDGMKLQPCAPGFESGRDAIIEADELANGGANKCLIWETFARRGLGFAATQGSSSSVSDGTAAFDIPVECENLGINDTNLDNKFIIYPNPSNGNINIKPLLDFGDANVSIYDINGRKVYNTNVNLQNTVSIYAQNLSSGMYIMQIDGVDYSHTAKLIIN
ncbi:MAG: T9SS-dependent M36 family metallopeptidase [Flavobacteriaceae bacterium]|nr:T9SS-dependent M36 family metallopeptidase [Flavobacteriaceae bacterium]